MRHPAPLTLDSITHTSLSTLCLTIAAEVTQRRQPNGDIYAYLAKRLIAAETQPGGPYAGADGSADLATNVAVGYLFLCLKKPLPQVDAYVATMRHTATPELAGLLAQYDDAKAALDPARPVLTPHPIYDQIYTRFSSLDEPLKTTSLGFLERLKSADTTQEIAMLPTVFYHSLTAPFSHPPLKILGKANVYTWIAYTIYDHIIDGEPQLHALPTANLSMRLALDRYQNIFPATHSFWQKISQTFTAMDAANSWELAHARFNVDKDTITIGSIPKYGRHEQLAQRSFAHALGPLAIATLATSRRENLTNLEKAFRHYLIARQLNDDLHDWQQDIRRGQATAVVSYILKHAKVKPGAYTINTLVARMQTNFWRHSMEALTALTLKHLATSRKYFLKSELLKEKSEFFTLIDRLENVATGSQQEHKRYQSFASAYRDLSR